MCAFSRRAHKFAGMIVHEALSWEVTTVRAFKGKPVVADGLFIESKERIGSFFLIEPKDLNEAIRVASKHPSAHRGEELGWRLRYVQLESSSPSSRRIPLPIPAGSNSIVAQMGIIRPDLIGGEIFPKEMAGKE